MTLSTSVRFNINISKNIHARFAWLGLAGALQLERPWLCIRLFRRADKVGGCLMTIRKKKANVHSIIEYFIFVRTYMIRKVFEKRRQSSFSELHTHIHNWPLALPELRPVFLLPTMPKLLRRFFWQFYLRLKFLPVDCWEEATERRVETQDLYFYNSTDYLPDHDDF